MQKKKWYRLIWLVVMLILASGCSSESSIATAPPTSVPSQILSTNPPPTAVPPTITLTPLPTDTPPPTDTPTPVVILSDIQIAEKVAKVLNGEGVSEATEYDQSLPGPHRIVLLTAEGNIPVWNDSLNPDWKPTTLAQVELVAVILPIRETVGTGTISICGERVYRIRMNTKAALYEAYTAKIISSNTFMGGNPPSLGSKIKCGTTAFYGEPVPFETVQAWLWPFVNP